MVLIISLPHDAPLMMTASWCRPVIFRIADFVMMGGLDRY